MQIYSDPSRADDKWSLPDAEVFELTAREVAEREEDLIADYMRQRKFRLAGMNSRDRDRMFDAMIEEQQISGGWFYWFCLPGCMPDSEPFGPYDTAEEAIAACRESVEC